MRKIQCWLFLLKVSYICLYNHLYFHIFVFHRKRFGLNNEKIPPKIIHEFLIFRVFRNWLLLKYFGIFGSLLEFKFS